MVALLGLLIGSQNQEKLKPIPEPRLATDLLVGALIIENKMGQKQDVVVNGVRYNIEPGWSELWVSRGIIYANLPDYEPIKRFTLRNWAWNGHNYEMKLVIQNQSLRPANWQYPSSYVEPVPNGEYPSSGGPVPAPIPAPMPQVVPAPTPARRPAEAPQLGPQPTLAPPKPAEPVAP